MCLAPLGGRVAQLAGERQRALEPRPRRRQVANTVIGHAARWVAHWRSEVVVQPLRGVLRQRRHMAQLLHSDVPVYPSYEPSGFRERRAPSRVALMPMRPLQRAHEAGGFGFERVHALEAGVGAGIGKPVGEQGVAQGDFDGGAEIAQLGGGVLA